MEGVKRKLGALFDEEQMVSSLNLQRKAGT
jgi:hypothetical protein